MVRPEYDAAHPVVAATALTTAHYQKCSRLLKRGEVKRVSYRGPLVGYYISCPACGFSASHLHDKHGFIEANPAAGTSWPRLLVGITTPCPCFKCRALLSVEDGKLVARKP